VTDGLSQDALRRELRDSAGEHRSTMAALDDALARVVDAGMDRRGLLRLGAGVGAGTLAASLLGACNPSRPHGPASVTTTSTSTTIPSPDVGLLRLASSIEHYAVGLYGQAAGLFHTQILKDAAQSFSDQHAEHAAAFERATSAAGGQPFTTANPALAQRLATRVQGLQIEADVVKLAYDVESLAAATYYASVGNLKDTKLNATMMSVGAVEARHVAVFGVILTGIAAPVTGIGTRVDSPPYPAHGSVQTAQGALAPGTGI
jgi:rubrerythrin